MELNKLIETRYGRMLYNRNDSIIGRSLELYGEWYQSELDWLQTFIRPGWHCLDVGANIGTHTLAFAKSVGVEGQVYAFEPQRLIFQLLCANIALNHFINIWAFPFGIGEVSGRATLPPINYLASGNFGAVKVASDGTIQSTDFLDSVEIVTIDSLALNCIDLIKIDVEGAELNVLKGGIKTITQHKPLLYLENHDPLQAPLVIQLIKSYGYHVYQHLAPGFNPNNFNHSKLNIHGNYLEKNIFCIPQSSNIPVDGIPL